MTRVGVRFVLCFSDLNVDDINENLELNTKGPFDVYIGNRELMKKQNIEIAPDADQQVRELEEKGKTGVFVAVNGNNSFDLCTLFILLCLSYLFYFTFCLRSRL